MTDAGGCLAGPLAEALVRQLVAREVYYVGSVKWLARPFSDRDLAALRRGALQVPGFDPGTGGLVAVSLSGVTEAAAGQLGLRWGPGEVVRAFRG